MRSIQESVHGRVLTGQRAARSEFLLTSFETLLRRIATRRCQKTIKMSATRNTIQAQAQTVKNHGKLWKYCMFSNMFNTHGEVHVATRLVPCLDAIKNASDDVVAARSLVALPFETSATLNMERMGKTMKENARNVSCWKQANAFQYFFMLRIMLRNALYRKPLVRKNLQRLELDHPTARRQPSRGPAKKW